MPLKPGTWSVDRASIDPAYDQLWSGLDFMLPLFEQTGERTHVYGKEAARFNRQQGDIPTTITRVPTEKGIALDHPGARYQLATSYLPPAKGTWLFVGSFDSAGATSRVYGSHDRFEIVINKSTFFRIANNFYAGGGQVLNGPFSLVQDVVHVIVCTWNSVTNRLEIYYNGVLVASDSNANDTPSSATLWMGGRSATFFDGKTLLMAQWDRVLGAGDVQLLQTDPFGMIREAQWPIWPAISANGAETVERTFTGVISSLTGALAKEAQVIYEGTDTPAGAVAKEVQVTFEGTDTSTGTILKEAQVTFEGSDTPTGALTNIKAILISMAGTIATITGALVKKPLIARGGTATSAGALAREPQIVRTGSDTPTGSLSKKPSVTFEGSDTPTGSLTVLKTLLQTVTGAISVITGALSFKVLKALAGSDTPTGSLDQEAAVTFEGANTPTGSLDKEPSVAFEGTITSAGVLTNIKAILLSVAGTLTSAGALARKVLWSRGGTVASSGILNKVPKVTFEGTVTSVGGLIKKVLKALAGVLTNAGSLATVVIVSGAPVVVRAFKAARRIVFSSGADDDFKGG